MKCIDCSNLHCVVPQFDQPHGEIYCGKGHFDGAKTDDLYEEHPVEDECKDYQVASVSGRNFFVSEEAVEHLINELARY